MEPPLVVEMTYQFEVQAYSTFIHDLRRNLAQHRDDERKDVLNHPVLPKQKSGVRPARWLHINLEGNNGERTTLAIRDDNVYLIGFKNQSGRWYEFGYSANDQHIDPTSTGTGRRESTRMLGPPQQDGEPSTFLECGSSYGCLVYGGAKWLVHVAQGNTQMRNAVRCLSSYNQDHGVGANARVKRALAQLIVMICEAARMSPPFNTVSDGWWEKCVYIPCRQVDYFWNWGDMSEALLRWKKDGFRQCYQLPDHLRDMLGTSSPSRALAIVELLLNRPVHRPPLWKQERRFIAAGGSGGRRPGHQPPTKRTRANPARGGGPAGQGHGRQQQPPPNQGGGRRSHFQRQPTPVPPESDDDDDCVAHARPLVEIFAVLAVGFRFLGTISVFDGRRGQVIYHNNLPIQDPPHQVRLSFTASSAVNKINTKALFCLWLACCRGTTSRCR